MEAFREQTAPLLTPIQVEEFAQDKRQMESALSAPPHISNQLQDRGEIVRQLQRLSRQLDKSTPRAYSQDQLDAAVRREAELRAQFTMGMPTQAEMRRNPVGAVDKHRKWEERNKQAVMEWKNIRRRLHASGAIDAPIDARDIANIEQLRPTGGSQELSMHGEQIPGKQFYMPGQVSAVTVISDREAALLQSIDPELAGKLALLSNEQRAEVKELLTAYTDKKDE